MSPSRTARAGRVTGTFILLATALALVACATGGSMGASPISGVQALAGVWEGTLDIGAGDKRCTLTIGTDGKATIVGETLTAYGTVTVKDGKGRYDFPARSAGAVTLYESGTSRQLALKGDSGVFLVNVTRKP